MDFPFDAAMRNPEQCLASIPIKAGVPDKYAFYAVGGRAKSPNPSLCLRHVPVLVICAASQETVSWSAYPHGFGLSAFIGNYRRDRDDNPGTDYEPRNELIGASWDMMSGHFDMFPRNYTFVANWLDAVAAARLPADPCAPLKTLTLRDGWLMNPSVPPTGAIPSDFPVPARYLDFKGARNKALWFPTEALARELFEVVRDEPRREIEMFTIRDPRGHPISLDHGSLASMPESNVLLQGDGRCALSTYHFTEPFDVCTVKDRDHGKNPQAVHTLENVLFPGKTSLPLSGIPLQFDPNGAPVELVGKEEFKDERGVTETRFMLKIKRHRLAPDCGFTMFFARIYHEGNSQFAASGRTVQVAWVPQDADKKGAQQTLTFPSVPDTRATVAEIELKAVSSAGLPVEYFVQKGPGIIKGGAFIPAEVPAAATKPIEVTIGAYQVGAYKESGGVKPTPAMYQSFRLIP